MKVSVTKAAKLADVSRTTLYNDMDKGKLSFHKTGKNKKQIEISELERVYGPLQLNDNKESSSVKAEQNLTKSSEQDASGLMELAVLREKLEIYESERKREREQLEGRINQLEETLKKSQENQNNTIRLLEHHTKEERGPDWQEAFQTLKEEIANKDQNTQEEKEKLLNEKQDLEKSNRLILAVTGVTLLAVAVAAYNQGMIVLPF